MGPRKRECIMQGDAKVIEYLNKGLRHELTAINQYWLHFRLLHNWGLLELAKQWRKESIEEMNHADRFTDRIIFLDGFPNMQVLDPLRIGQNVKEIIECDLAASKKDVDGRDEPGHDVRRLFSQLCLVAGHDFGLAFRLAQFGLVVDHFADAGKNRAFDPRLLRPQFCAHQRLAAMEIGFVHIDAQDRAWRLAEFDHRSQQIRFRRQFALAADAQRLVDAGHEEDQLHEA